jgi:tRNA 2-thiouridine synthesizing protein E
MEATLLKPDLATNEEGYLKKYEEWNDDWASAVAAEHNIELTDRHWAILYWLRKKQSEGVALTIRKVANSGLADIKEFYQLFPGGPLKVSSKIAGIPKPVSCI